MGNMKTSNLAYTGAKARIQCTSNVSRVNTREKKHVNTKRHR